MKRKSNRFLIWMLTIILAASLTPLGGMTVLAGGSEPEACFLKFYLSPDDDEFYVQQLVEKGSAPTKIDAPVQEGMSLLGWYKDRELTIPFSFSDNMYQDTEIFARYEKNEKVVGVNFFMGPDEDYPFADQLLLKGEYVKRPEDPSKGDLVFAGWYSDRELKTPYDFSAPLYDYLLLFARFVASEDCYSVYIYLDPKDSEYVTGFDVPKGEPIPQPAEPAREDATFAGWYSDRELTQKVDFTAPRSEDISLFPRFVTEEDCYVVRIYLRSDSPEPTTGFDVPKGEPIPQPAEPAREDAEFTGWYTDRELTQPADFTKPRSQDVNLYAGWKETPYDNPFVDVKDDDYFAAPVKWAVKKKVTKGIDDTHFAPNNTCTRSQVVTFLWRAAGSPEPASDVNPFTDVKKDDYYYKAVLWAVEKGITKGTSDTTFGSGQGCTRGQVVTFLHRFENSPAPGSAANPFIDVSAADYFAEPVLWAVGRNITKGMDDTHFAPNAICTRGQIVTFLYRDMD